MDEVALTDPEGVRFLPAAGTGVGALVLAGSSGRVDVRRARLLAEHGVLAEAIRWFGGPGQHDAPWEIPIELFLDRVGELRRDCDRVVVIGTSFGAEAALLTGALSDEVDTVAAFAPSDVVWAGVRPDGEMTSHWSHDGKPWPYVRFDPDWTAEEVPPAYAGLYRASRRRFADLVPAATIPAERVRRLLLVAGGDDRVWPAVDQAEAIRARRAARGQATTVVTEPLAGHRTILPGEEPIHGGISMRRGGDDAADRRLGLAAWTALTSMLDRR